VRSALTQEVKVIEVLKDTTHAALMKMTSGQLWFPGSTMGLEQRIGTCANRDE
jgi:hypothetical protein